MSELYLIYLFIVETKNVTEHQLRLFLVNVFFQSGLIVSKNRAGLSPANVNKLVCLNNCLGL